MLEHFAHTAPRTDYEWAQYADGEWWEFRKGEDYEAQTQSVRASLNSWGKRNGYKVSSVENKDRNGFLFSIKSE